MNSITRRLLLSTALLSGLLFFSVSLSAQTIRGSGNIQSQTRETGNFNSISSAGIFKIIITQGNSTAVKVETDDNILPYVITEVQGNELKLETKSNVNLKPSKEVDVYITVNKLDNVLISGACSLESTNTLKQYQLDFNLSGTSNLNLDLDVKRLSTSISGTGNATFKGKSTTSDYRISGTGNIDAKSLTNDNATVAISGMGKIHVNAEKQLNVFVSGMGKVWYQGNPQITQSVSGMGSITKE